MKQLEIEFDGTRSQKGYKFLQLHRSGMTALYQKQSDDAPISFEVIRIRIQKECEVSFPGAPTVFYEEKEIYPIDEKFGIDAFAYFTYEGAMDKYRNLMISTDDFSTISPK